MLKNYFKVAWRKIQRQKGYSFINITGLAIGLASCIFILLFVCDELSYDGYHPDAENIYRVWTYGKINGTDFNLATAAPPVGPRLTEEFPEVLAYTRLRNYGYPVLRYGDHAFSEERWFHADSTIFDVFGIEFIAGNAETALSKVHSAVLTESMARKYFGDEDPMGKIINSDKRLDYEVTGIIKDCPDNTHFHFDFLASGEIYRQNFVNDNWLNANLHTYVKLAPNTDVNALEAKVNVWVKQHVGRQLQEFLHLSEEEIEGSSAYQLRFMPLTDIHLRSHLEYEIEPNGQILYIYIFAIIALFILVIAGINFMNLSTARSAKRAKEVGIRKTLGAERKSLIGQFLVESIILTFFAMLIAIVLVVLMLPAFNQLTHKDLQFSLQDILQWAPLFLATTIITGFLAGLYPAFFLSSFKPTKVLKGSGAQNGHRSFLRSGLVIFQFMVAITLFIGTFIVYDQLSMIETKDLGFNPHNLIVIEKTDDLRHDIHPFMERLQKISGVESVGNAQELFGGNFDNMDLRRPDQDEPYLPRNLHVNYDFADTYGLEIKDGRFFSRSQPDSFAIVLNEEAVRAFQLENPIGQELLTRWNNHDIPMKIIGVVKNFHFESLHQPIRPFVLRLRNPAWWGGRYTTLRVQSENTQEILNQAEAIWRDYNPVQEFEYVYFDEEFGKHYQEERRTRTILVIFSFLTLFIACLGLLGLASYTTEQRTKEIGVRKVLGASIGSIVMLLSQEVVRWVLYANILAWPIAWYVMSQWLQNFAYRIPIPYESFVFAGLLALAVAWVTVSTQTVRAAATKPVNTLKYE